MDQTDFNLGIRDLNICWPKFYNESRVNLIWDIVKNQSTVFFNKLIKDCIANNRHAPLPVEFMNAISSNQKNIYSSSISLDGWKNHTSIFREDEIKEIFDVMRKAALGLISSAQAAEYADTVAVALESKGISLGGF